MKKALFVLTVLTSLLFSENSMEKVAAAYGKGKGTAVVYMVKHNNMSARAFSRETAESHCTSSANSTNLSNSLKTIFVKGCLEEFGYQIIFSLLYASSLIPKLSVNEDDELIEKQYLEVFSSQLRDKQIQFS